MKKSTKKKKDELAAVMKPKLETAAAARIGMRLEIPADVMIKLPHIELTGNREILIDGVRSISEYGETCVILDCGKINVRITGTSVCINRYLEDIAVVTGVLTEIAFS